MSLELEINDGIKQAMMSKEKVKLTALRAVKSEIMLVKTSDGSSEIDDDKVLKIIQKLVKQRKESAALYVQNNREDLADSELAEAAALEGYLPKPLSDDELTAALIEIIARTGASSPADMGKVMGMATKQLAGRAEGKVISEKVRNLLAK